MKRTFKSLFATFIIGLLIIGVGSGVCFAEVTSLDYMGERKIDRANYSEKVKEMGIPEMAQVVKVGYWGEVKVVEVQGMKDNRIEFNYKISPNEYFNINQEFNEYDYNNNYDNNNNYNNYNNHGYNENGEYNDNGQYAGSERQVRREACFYVNYNGDSQLGFNMFKESIEDLKNNQFYSYTYDRPELVVKVSPATRSKLIIE